MAIRFRYIAMAVFGIAALMSHTAMAGTPAHEGDRRVARAIKKIDHHKIKLLPNAAGQMPRCDKGLAASIMGRSGNIQTISITCPSAPPNHAPWTIYAEAIVQHPEAALSAPTSQSHVLSKIVIRNGEKLTAIVQQGGISISTKAIALQSGALNQQIEVENTQTHKRFNAKIVDALPVGTDGVFVLNRN